MLAGAALAACGTSDAGDNSRKTTYVLVHGSFHGAWCFELVKAILEGQGHPVVAHDLPGHGLLAAIPLAYSQFPRTVAFNTEVSPVAGITAKDYVDQVAGIVQTQVTNGSGPVVLLGHSMGGLVIQAVAERLGPSKIKRLVYLSAFMPADGKAPADVLALPSQSDALVLSLLLADPAQVGALRIDPNSPDPVYAARAKAAFYGDVDDTIVRSTLNMLTPDDPAQPFSIAIALSSANWGSIPRTFIKCLRDFAVRPGTADAMIADADVFSPSNKTQVVTLDTSHSSFLSQPQALSDVLLAAA